MLVEGKEACPTMKAAFDRENIPELVARVRNIERVTRKGVTLLMYCGSPLLSTINVYEAIA
jgi:hypothetical protein